MGTWQEIKADVEANGNVLTVTMERLRSAHGAGRLGSIVCPAISRELAGIGLGHVPEELPSSQEQQVRLFKQGTQVGELITTVLRPSKQGDKKLVDKCAESLPDYAEIVQRIREIVAE